MRLFVIDEMQTVISIDEGGDVASEWSKLIRRLLGRLELKMRKKVLDLFIIIPLHNLFTPTTTIFRVVIIFYVPS